MKTVRKLIEAIEQDDFLVKLKSAAIAFDRKEAKKKYYNMYALPQYLQAIEYMVDAIKNGMKVEDAIKKYSQDTFYTALMKAIKK